MKLNLSFKGINPDETRVYVKRIYKIKTENISISNQIKQIKQSEDNFYGIIDLKGFDEDNENYKMIIKADGVLFESFDELEESLY